jgi:shikimate kinase
VTELRAIRNIALVGFMGTGKSTVGRHVAEELHFTFIDTDELIERAAGKPITRIFSEDGEPAFRQLESAVVHQLESREKCVIATGGGLIMNPTNLESLKRHALVACLWASPDAIWQRTRHQTHRPLLNCEDPLAKIRSLLASREPFYRQADVLVNTEFRSIRDVAHQVVHYFQQSAAKAQPRH